MISEDRKVYSSEKEARVAANSAYRNAVATRQDEEIVSMADFSANSVIVTMPDRMRGTITRYFVWS